MKQRKKLGANETPRAIKLQRKNPGSGLSGKGEEQRRGVREEIGEGKSCGGGAGSKA